MGRLSGSGVIKGPYLNGKIVPSSGGDYALFRPDDTVELNGRYMLEADDGTLIIYAEPWIPLGKV